MKRMDLSMEKELALEVIKEEVVCGKEFKIYGSIDNPLFLAKDVANWIEYDSTSTAKMLKTVDEDEKLIGTLFLSGQNREVSMITEDGLYEILMLSRKPIAKEFKKEVKKILKQMRLTGASFVSGREDEVVARYFPRFSDETKLAMVQELIVENDAIKLELSQNKEVIKQQSGTIAFIKMVSDKSGTISMKRFADSLSIKGLGRNALYELLRKMGFVSPDSTAPYRRWIEQGILEAKASVSKNGKLTYSTRITLKGQEYLTKKILKELGESKLYLSDEVKDYAKQLIDIIGKTEEEYLAMLRNPKAFVDEWIGVIRFAEDTEDDNIENITHEIEEILK